MTRKLVAGISIDPNFPAFWCAYHQEPHDGEPFTTRLYECAQHGPETMSYCKSAANWLGLVTGDDPA